MPKAKLLPKATPQQKLAGELQSLFDDALMYHNHNTTSAANLSSPIYRREVIKEFSSRALVIFSEYLRALEREIPE